MLLLVVLILAVLVAAASAAAAAAAAAADKTYVSASSGADNAACSFGKPCATLAAAVKAVAAGGEVSILDGRFVGRGNVAFTITKNVTIAGQFAFKRDQYRIEWLRGNRGAFHVTLGASVTFRSLSMGNENSGQLSPMVAVSGRGSVARLENVAMVNFTSGVKATNHGTAVLENCVFARQGAYASATALAVGAYGSVRAHNTTFNVTARAVYGDIQRAQMSVALTNCLLYGNYRASVGVAMAHAAHYTVDVRNSKFFDFTTAAVAVSGPRSSQQPSRGALIDVDVVDTSCRNAPGGCGRTRSGGVSVSGGSWDIERVAFTRNGGGLSNMGGALAVADADASVLQCTFANNTATSGSPWGYGGGVYCGAKTKLTLRNNRFAYNAARRGGAAACDAACVLLAADGNTFVGNRQTDAADNDRPCKGLPM